MMQKSDKQWRQELTEEQYQVLRKKATEAPFSGEYDRLFEDGKYVCAGCGAELFDASTKFEAYCGWPSFFDAKPNAVEFHRDDSLGMERIEATCANCGGHLGHVFEGENFNTPTDQRYCINSLSLKFEKE